MCNIFSHTVWPLKSLSKNYCLTWWHIPSHCRFRVGNTISTFASLWNREKQQCAASAVSREDQWRTSAFSDWDWEPHSPIALLVTWNQLCKLLTFFHIWHRRGRIHSSGVIHWAMSIGCPNIHDLMGGSPTVQAKCRELIRNQVLSCWYSKTE